MNTANKKNDSSLVALKSDSKDYKSYGILTNQTDPSFVSDGLPLPLNIALLYPTVCKSKDGLMLYGTPKAYNKDGKSNNKPTDGLGAWNWDIEIERFNIDPSTCRTIRLKSHN